MWRYRWRGLGMKRLCRAVPLQRIGTRGAKSVLILESAQVEKRHPISLLVEAFLKGIRPKPQFCVQQQAADIAVEAGHPYFGGPVLGKGKGNHLFDEGATHAASPGSRADDDVADGATSPCFPSIKVGKSDNGPSPFHHRWVGALGNRLPQLGRL